MPFQRCAELVRKSRHEIVTFVLQTMRRALERIASWLIVCVAQYTGAERVALAKDGIFITPPVLSGRYDCHMDVTNGQNHDLMRSIPRKEGSYECNIKLIVRAEPKL